MKNEFKLVGLQKVHNQEEVIATLEYKKEETFKALIDHNPKQKMEMFDYVKHDWKNTKIATVKHDGFYKNGSPINPVLISIRLENP